MNAGGETADQVVKMSLEGIEVAANIALKAGGNATRSLAAMLYAILTDQKKVKGKTRLNSLLKSGKELKVFANPRGICRGRQSAIPVAVPGTSCWACSPREIGRASCRERV